MVQSFIELSPEDRRCFEEKGYLVLPGVLSAEFCARAEKVIDKITRPLADTIINSSDIMFEDPLFLEFLDHPEVLLRVRSILGWNIWVNQYHLNVTRSTAVDQPLHKEGYVWHRDSARIYDDLGPDSPRVSIKVGFYLTDLMQEGGGQTYLIPTRVGAGSVIPEPREMPDDAVPLCVPPGSIVFFDNQMIHSAVSPNTSSIERRVFFVQYAYRWICPVNRPPTDVHD